MRYIIKVTKCFILFYNRKIYKINAVRFNFLITKNPKKGFSTTVFTLIIIVSIY